MNYQASKFHLLSRLQRNLIICSHIQIRTHLIMYMEYNVSIWLMRHKNMFNSKREQLTLWWGVLGDQPCHFLRAFSQFDVLFHSKQFIHQLDVAVLHWWGICPNQHCNHHFLLCPGVDDLSHLGERMREVSTMCFDAANQSAREYNLKLCTLDFLSEVKYRKYLVTEPQQCLVSPHMLTLQSNQWPLWSGSSRL